MKNELTSFFYFLRLMWLNRKFIIVFNSIVFFLAIIISLLLPKWYKASCLVYIHSGQTKDFSITNMLQGLPVTLGGKGDMNIERNQALMSSRRFKDLIIDEFNLQEEYDVKFREDVYKILSQNLMLIDHEDGTFSLSGYYKNNPVQAAELVNFAVNILIELNIQIDQKNASDYRDYLEKSYETTKSALFAIEDSMRIYQEETKIYQLEDQIKVLIEQISDLESQKIKNELELEYLKLNVNNEHFQIEKLENQIRTIQHKIDQLKNSNNYSNLIYNQIPAQGMKYLQLYREVMIGQKVMEILLPQLEKAKIEEHKSYSSLIVIDKAVPAERKARPKRSVIVLISTFFSAIFSIICVYVYNFINLNLNKIRTIFTR